MLIAGDIGGTKTLLALYSPEQGARKPILETEFHSASYSSLDDMVKDFIARLGQPVKTACFDVAGPVIGGRARLTNLPWVLDETTLQQSLGLEQVVLLNDLKAVAYAVPHLLPADLHVINAGKPERNGCIAVVAPGTGLGEAFLVWSGSQYVACSSEGGHADFAPADETQAALWRYLFKRHGHVAYERVCSGSGIPNLYDFLREDGTLPEHPGFAAELAEVSDRTPLIMQAALRDPPDPLSSAALDIFVAALGAEAGNLALKVISTGGVYLAGGIPPRILPRLDDGRFMQAFVDKGRLGNLLRDMPVKVVTNQVALLGAALYGLDRLAGK